MIVCNSCGKPIHVEQAHVVAPSGQHWHPRCYAAAIWPDRFRDDEERPSG